MTTADAAVPSARPAATGLLCILALLAGSAPSRLARGAPALMPTPKRWNELTAMMPKAPQGVGRPITDREAWKELAASPSLKGFADKTAGELKKPASTVTDDDYLSYAKTGRRTQHSRAFGALTDRYRRLVYAECIEARGRFIPAIEETIGALCALKTWVPPYHDHGQMNFLGKGCSVDLYSATLSSDLATGCWWLGERLSQPVREQLLSELKRRTFDPVRAAASADETPRNMWWLQTTNNWNAVCNAGVTIAALSVLEAPRDRALLVGIAESSMRRFREGFTDHGYCSEGLGYWNYGFSNAILLADAVAAATAGKVDLLAGDKMDQVCLFGARMEVLPGVYPAIADASVDTAPNPLVMGYVSRRLGLGWTRWDRSLGPAEARATNLAWTGVFAFPHVRPPAEASKLEVGGLRAPRDWFPVAQFLLCRPGPNVATKLAVAIKGGHNAEHHNHNDVGTYTVAVGKETPLLDPGTVVYTAKTFSAQRYEIRVINSYGHPVPVVAGRLQKTGRNAEAKVVRTNFTDGQDELVLDIAAAYDAPELEKLTRTYVYDRGGAGSLTVTDEAAFGKPASFETALITYGDWRTEKDGSLIVTDRKESLRVTIDTAGRPYETRAERIDEEVRAKRKPLRIGIALKQPGKAARVTVRIEPR